jgi:hypothetical protein
MMEMPVMMWRSLMASMHWLVSGSWALCWRTHLSQNSLESLLRRCRWFLESQTEALEPIYDDIINDISLVFHFLARVTIGVSEVVLGALPVAWCILKGVDIRIEHKDILSENETYGKTS